MKLHLLLLTALVCGIGAHDPSESSSRSDKQTLKAHKMAPPPSPTTTVSDSTKTSASLDESNAEDSFDSLEAPEPRLERQPVEAQVMLGNVDIDELTADETLFFQSALRQAIQLAQDQEHDRTDEVTIGAILVENGHGAHKNDGRALRKRELGWSFNIWTILDTFRCTFCPADDDYGDYYEQWRRNRPKFTRAPTPAPTPSPTWEIDDDSIAWFNALLRARYGDGRRHLGVSDSNTSLEDILCELLREGPFERFHSVNKCAIDVSKW